MVMVCERPDAGRSAEEIIPGKPIPRIAPNEDRASPSYERPL